MPVWNIPVMKPGERDRPNPPQLVNCSIKETENRNGYEFRGPDGHVQAVTTGGRLPEGRFRFPMFRAQLNGPIRQDWYITVETLHTGAFGNIGWGYFGHDRYPPEKPEDPTDTWVAQAGASAGDDEDDQAAAASASSKQ